MSHKAVFLDRDGVINHEREYLYKKQDFYFIDGVFEACRRFQSQGYLLIVITNQSGIARGMYTEQEFHELTEWMKVQFLQRNIDISAVYYCPHHPNFGCEKYKQVCRCRKPEPGMIIQAQSELDIDLSQSILFGDKASDIEAGRRAGVGFNVLVESGHFLSEDEKQLADAVLPSLQFIPVS